MLYPYLRVAIGWRSLKQGRTFRVKSETELLLMRARVMDELADDGLNVAVPMKRCRVDLLAFLDTADANGPIVTVPIEVRGSADFYSPDEGDISERSASLIAYVFRGAEPMVSQTLAFTPIELRTVIQTLRHAIFATEGRREEMRDQLFGPFVMSKGEWRKRIKALSQMRVVRD